MSFFGGLLRIYAVLVVWGGLGLWDLLGVTEALALDCPYPPGACSDCCTGRGALNGLIWLVPHVVTMGVTVWAVATWGHRERRRPVNPGDVLDG